MINLAAIYCIMIILFGYCAETSKNNLNYFVSTVFALLTICLTLAGVYYLISIGVPAQVLGLIVMCAGSLYFGTFLAIKQKNN